MTSGWTTLLGQSGLSSAQRSLEALQCCWDTCAVAAGAWYNLRMVAAVPVCCDV